MTGRCSNIFGSLLSSRLMILPVRGREEDKELKPQNTGSAERLNIKSQSQTDRVRPPLLPQSVHGHASSPLSSLKSRGDRESMAVSDSFSALQLAYFPPTCRRQRAFRGWRRSVGTGVRGARPTTATATGRMSGRQTWSSACPNATLLRQDAAVSRPSSAVQWERSKPAAMQQRGRGGTWRAKRYR